MKMALLISEVTHKKLINHTEDEILKNKYENTKNILKIRIIVIIRLHEIYRSKEEIPS